MVAEKCRVFKAETRRDRDEDKVTNLDACAIQVRYVSFMDGDGDGDDRGA